MSISIVIRGDYTGFQADMARVRAIALSNAQAISDAMNNSISTNAAATQISGIARSLNVAARAALGVKENSVAAMDSIRKIGEAAGVSGRQFERMAQQSMRITNARQIDIAMRNLQRATGASIMDMAKLRASVGDVTGGIRAMGQAAEDSFKKIANLRNAAIAAAAGYAVVGAGKTAMQFDTYQRSFNAISGSQAGGADEMRFVSQEAERLGQDLFALADSYRGLAAAAKTSGLSQEQVRDVFSSVGEASTILGLRSEQTKYALYALQQMMSKGVVSMEELRRQLGDSLPGAFSAAARAMNVTEAQLVKMVESGELVSRDFLPKFAAELRRTFTGFDEASQAAARNFTRLGNAITEAKGTVGKGFLDEAASGATRLTDALKNNQAALEGVGKALGFVASNADVLVAVVGANFLSRGAGNLAAFTAAAWKGADATRVAAQSNLRLAQSAVTAAQAQARQATSAMEAQVAIRALARAQAELSAATTAAAAAQTRAAVIMSGLGKAGMGIVNFFGGPWVAAFTAAAGALYYFHKRAEETQQLISGLASQAAETGVEVNKMTDAMLRGNQVAAETALEKAKTQLAEIKKVFANTSASMNHIGAGFHGTGSRRILPADKMAASQVMTDFEKGLIDGGEAFKRIDEAQQKFGEGSAKVFTAAREKITALEVAMGNVKAAANKVADAVGNIAKSGQDKGGPGLADVLKQDISESERLFRQFSARMSGGQLLGLSKSVSDFQKTESDFKEMMAGMVNTAKDRQGEIAKAMADGVASPYLIAKAKRVQNEISRGILNLEKQTVEGRMQIYADFIAQQEMALHKLMGAESETADQRKIFEAEVAASAAQAAYERELSAKRANAEIRKNTITEMNSVIAKFAEMAAAGSAASKVVADAFVNATAAAHKAIDSEITDFENSGPGLIEATRERVLSSFGGGGGGNKGGGLASSKNAQPYLGIVNDAAKKHGVPVDLILAVIKTESAFNPNAVSHVGARGLMQLMPGTARDLGVSNSFDPAQNVDGGTRYLAQMLAKFGGNTKHALMAYNWGPGNMGRWLEKGGQGKVPLETRNYVSTVMGNMQSDEAKEQAGALREMEEIVIRMRNNPLEIASMEGLKNIERITELAQKAGLSYSETTKYISDYQSALAGSQADEATKKAREQAQAMRDMEMSMAQMRGDKKEVARLEGLNELERYAELAEKAGLNAAEAMPHIKAFEEAQASKAGGVNIEHLQEQLNFYEQLRNVMPAAGEQYEALRRQVLDLEAAQYEAIGISKEYLDVWKEFATLREATDGLSGLRVAMMDYTAGLTGAAMAQDFFNTSAQSVASEFTNMVTGAQSASEAFSNMANTIVNKLVEIAVQMYVMKPIVEWMQSSLGGGGASAGGGIGGFLGNFFSGMLASAKGNVFPAGPGISAYSGQVVTRPTVFPFARGIGLMGEAGAEAIMPLRRDSSGRLGVSAADGYGQAAPVVNVKVVNQTSVPVTPEVSTSTDSQNGTTTMKVLLKQVDQSMEESRRRGQSQFGRGIEADGGLASSRMRRSYFGS